MPNGKLFLKFHPWVEFGSEEWKIAAPLSIGGVVVYCCGFLAYTIHAVRRIPQCVCEDESFVDQYDFLVADIRPHCFLWSFVVILWSFMIGLVQSLTSNVYFQLHISILLICMILMGNKIMQPSVHRSVNTTHTLLDFALLTFLIFATAFIDVEGLDMHEHRAPFAYILLFITCVSTIFVMINVLQALHLRFLQPPVTVTGSLRMALQLKDFASSQVSRPIAEYVPHFADLPEVDADMLEEALSSLTAVFFQLQSSSAFFKQRIIPDAKSELFPDSATTKLALQKSRTGFTHSSIISTFSSRVNMEILRKEMLQGRGDGPILTHVQAMGSQSLHVSGVVHHLPAMPSTVSALISRTAAGSRMQGRMSELALRYGLTHVSEADFVDELRGISSLTEEDLCVIFRNLNVEGSDSMRVTDLLRALQSIVQYEDSQPRRSRTVLLDTMEDETSDAWELQDEEDEMPQSVETIQPVRCSVPRNKTLFTTYDI